MARVVHGAEVVLHPALQDGAGLPLHLARSGALLAFQLAPAVLRGFTLIRVVPGLRHAALRASGEDAQGVVNLRQDVIHVRLSKG